jgi:hypothetical protein
MASNNAWLNSELDLGKGLALALVEHLIRVDQLSAEIPTTINGEEFIVSVRRKPTPTDVPQPVQEVA